MAFQFPINFKSKNVYENNSLVAVSKNHDRCQQLSASHFNPQSSKGLLA
jgi:hypothetical protein